MEPRVFTRGNVKAHRGDWLTELRLQWSHASSRVETSALLAVSYPVLQLQWSHASSRVETFAVDFYFGAVVLASMEPRVFTRGNAREAYKRARAEFGFNGATRL